MPDLVYLQEPMLLFGYDQPIEDPRDGLSLFGPLDAGKPYGVRAERLEPDKDSGDSGIG